jgi:hypothetical protein
LLTTWLIADSTNDVVIVSPSIPEEWLRQVDFATTKMPVTNSRRTVKQTADGLYEAFRARLRRTRTYVEEMEKA